jgi:DNA repair photolyase
MDVRTTTARSILTEQRSGFLTSPPYPFTHSLAPYTGCAFGATTCGMYCYAQYLPNWTYAGRGARWGSAVVAKDNAPDLLHAALRSLSPAARQNLRIFMSSSTDPYQPIERRWRLTRRCLEVFARYPDLDLLVLQTRSPLASRDFDVLRQIPYAWLSVSVETDDPGVFTRLRGGPSPSQRLALVRAAADQNLAVQITVSPCLPYTAAFASTLAGSGAQRVVVDTFVDGDGTAGRRTAHSDYARAVPEWSDARAAHALFEDLIAAGVAAGWSTAGFCGIPPRRR